MDIQSAITQHASENEALQSTLAQTDYAKPALAQQTAYIADLNTELIQLKSRIAELSKKTNIEKQEHEKYRDSRFKRFKYALGGSKGKEKLAARISKEEAEYFEARHEEEAARDRQTGLEYALREANESKDQYANAARAHDEAQSQLDALYNMIFQGATPAFPEEDEAEAELSRLTQEYNTAQQRHQSITQAQNCLLQTKAALATAIRETNEALSWSSYDMMGGGMFADMQERSALDKASQAVSKTQMALDQARRYEPAIQPLGEIQVAQGSLLSDVMFDNIFTDYNFHQKIKATYAQLVEAAGNLGQQMEMVRKWELERKEIAEVASVQVQEARKRLQDVRKDVFTRLGGSVDPPPYSE